MSKEIEFERYIEFIRENFPKTVWLSEVKRMSNLSLLHSATFDNILIFEVFKEWSKNNSCPGIIRFLEDYKEYLSSILIALPVNHPGFISYLIRSSSESALKYLYSISYPSVTEEEIARTAFRHLKKDLKSVYKTESVYQEVLNLLNLYGKYSKEIHLHITSNVNSIGTINYYTDSFFTNINDNIKDIILLVNLFTELVSFSLHFQLNKNTFSSIKRLERNLEQSRLSLLSITVKT